jgi:NAD(P)H dehydrogenase (quinone)
MPEYLDRVTCTNEGDAVRYVEDSMVNAVKGIVVYHSQFGHTEKLAYAIAEGAREVEGTTVRVLSVGDASHADLLEADLIFWGSPNHFGNMSLPMKRFVDGTVTLFDEGKLSGKVGSVFTCSEALHGDQEYALWSLLLPMLQHGMVVVGLDPREPANDKFGYHFGVGASSLGCEPAERPDAEELAVARAMGRRAASVAQRLMRGHE